MNSWNLKLGPVDLYGMRVLARKSLAVTGMMRAEGLEWSSLCVEQAIVKPVSVRNERDRSREPLLMNAFWMRRQCRDNCRLK